MQFGALDFLSELRSEDVDWIITNSQPKTILSDGLLLQEGRPNDAIYFVSEGLFDISIRGPGGAPRTISRAGPGQILGDMSWLDAAPTSATVTASESGAVLVLPAAVLQSRLAGDTAFAASFYRALARTLSVRLRGMDLLAKDISDAPDRPSLNSSAASAAFDDFRDLLMAVDKAAIKPNNPEIDGLKSQVRAKFKTLVRGMNDIVESEKSSGSARDILGRMFQREMLPYILLAHTAERFYAKPRGYAGDYLTIEMIYENVPSGGGRIGPLIDECFLDEPAPRAVRNRRRLLFNEIKNQQSADGRPLRVTSMACGPAREMFDAMDKLGDKAIEFCGLDIDHDALALVKQRAAAEHRAVRVEHANLIYLAAGRQQVELPPQDLMYSIGLIDYFNDKLVIKLIDWIHDQLRPGGRVILGNFHPRNPDRAIMDHVLEWKLIHRDERDMDALFAASKFRRPCTRILFEEEGVNLFAECVKE